MFLYHYYEKKNGPFLNLSDLSFEEAKQIQDSLIKDGKVFASQRNGKYLERRKYLEQLVQDNLQYKFNYVPYAMLI